MNTTIACALSGLLFASPLLASSSEVALFPQDLRQKIKHVIIIYPEGRSFDNLYGNFNRGYDGSLRGGTKQLMQKGMDYQTLPQPNAIRIPGVPEGPDSRFDNVTLKNMVYDLQPYVPNDAREGDMVQRFYHEQYQINNKQDRFKDDPKNAGGGPMSKFAAWSDNPGFTMGVYNASDLGEGRLTKEFVLCDNAFHSAFGDSYLNHMWLIAARTPVWPANPTVGLPEAGSGADPVNATQFDTSGVFFGIFNKKSYPKPQLPPSLLSDGVITNDSMLPGFPMSNAAKQLGNGDYWSVNGTFPLRGPAGGLNTIDPNPPAPAVTVQPQQPTFDTPLKNRLPLQTYDTIGDRLDNAKPYAITWAWYAQGWNDAKAGKANYLFQSQHQPFTYFAKYALNSTPTPASGSNPPKPGTDSPGSKAHLKDMDDDFFTDLSENKLPRVSFIKPAGQKNEHPGNASVKEGSDWINDTVTKIRDSAIWNECVIFIMYDNNGGQWDHVTPPVIDEWGPGTRVPLTVISPFAKKGFTDHTQYETVSLLAFIEKLYKLNPLNTRDAQAQPPVSSFEGQPDLILHAVVGQQFTYVLPLYGSGPIMSFELSGDLDGLEVSPISAIISGNPAQKGSFDNKLTINLLDGRQKISTLRLDVDDKGD